MSREALENVLGPKDARELWTAGYRPALPITPQDFALGSVLPAVLYMMRWGHRRGKGRFTAIYGQKAPVARVVEGLAARAELEGFGGDVGHAILGDLLLAYCLENRKRLPGREEPVQRAFPTHYFVSWVDLPIDVGHLRGVPECITALLARQEEGEDLRPGGRGLYAIAAGFQNNLLLKLFGRGAGIEGQADSLTSDRFDEQTPVAIDELLGIRLGLSLGEAPGRMRGEMPLIPNQLPAATLAADYFFEDLNVFLRAYGRRVPRPALLPMLESALAVGLSNIFLSTFHALLRWTENGTLPPREEQRPWPLFVDCSVSQDHQLRRISEESVDDLFHRLRRFPSVMKYLHVADRWAITERLELPSAGPDPTERLNCLGDLLFERREESRDLYRDLRKQCNGLADELRRDGPPEVVAVLENEKIHPALRLAEGIVLLMGDKLQFSQYRKCLDSCLMTGQPNGLCKHRKSTVGGRGAERRSLVLSNTVLDFLVHRHLRKAARGTRQAVLSLSRFLEILRDRYGFYVAEAPPGISIPTELLRRNRMVLERRLRDLGLLVGVNDAESMKRLRSRYRADGDGDE